MYKTCHVILRYFYLAVIIGVTVSCWLFLTELHLGSSVEGLVIVSMLWLVCYHLFMPNTPLISCFAFAFMPMP